MLPRYYRQKALDISQNNPSAGHSGCAETRDRLFYQCYWPGFTQTNNQFCRTYEICQHMTPKCKNPKAFVQENLSSRKFQKIAVDIVGPLNTVSEKVN